MLAEDRTGQHNYTLQKDPVGQWSAVCPPITGRAAKATHIEHTGCNSQADLGNRSTGGTENQRAGIQHV